MKLIFVRFLALAVPLVCANSLLGVARADEPAEGWPATVVTIEELRAQTKFRLWVEGVVVRGKVRGPAVLRAHIDSEGTPIRVALLDSCGNGDLDEAAIRALRGMRFEPFIADGSPTPVSLVLPVHIPQRYGRTR